MIEDNLDESEIYHIRKQKLADLRSNGFNFPNQFRRQHLALDLINQYSEISKEELADKKV